MRAHHSKPTPRILSPSHTACPKGEERLKSRSTCEVQQALPSQTPSLAFINIHYGLARFPRLVPTHRSTDISSDPCDAFTLLRLKHCISQMRLAVGGGRGREAGFKKFLEWVNIGKS